MRAITREVLRVYVAAEMTLAWRHDPDDTVSTEEAVAAALALDPDALRAVFVEIAKDDQTLFDLLWAEAKGHRE